MQRGASISKQRLIVGSLVLAAVFSPSLLTWILHSEGAWYRPFVVWFVVIILTYIFQRSGSDIDQL